MKLILTLHKKFLDFFFRRTSPAQRVPETSLAESRSRLRAVSVLGACMFSLRVYVRDSSLLEGQNLVLRGRAGHRALFSSAWQPRCFVQVQRTSAVAG